MTKPNRPSPPSHLSDAMKIWWRQVNIDFELAGHHLHLLRLCCEALDTAETARQALALHGTTHEDRNGIVRLRPEAALQRDSRLAAVRIIRELGLDVQPPASTRPPPLRSNRG
jgi:phage terminase small subunit